MFFEDSLQFNEVWGLESNIVQPHLQKSHLSLLISKLHEVSSYEKFVSSVHTLLHSEKHGTFTSKRITDPDDAALLQMHEIFFKEFSYEWDYLPYVKEWVKNEDISYNVILDSEQNVIAAANSSYLSLDSLPSESILAIWFIAVDKRHRGKRMVNELYHEIYNFALNRSVPKKI